MFYNFFYGKYIKRLTYCNNYKGLYIYRYEIALFAKGINNYDVNHLLSS